MESETFVPQKEELQTSSLNLPTKPDNSLGQISNPKTNASFTEIANKKKVSDIDSRDAEKIVTADQGYKNEEQPQYQQKSANSGDLEASSSSGNPAIELAKSTSDEIPQCHDIEITKLTNHPKNDFLPKLTDEQYQGLKERIQQFGFNQHEAVEVTKDLVLLDGHNRVAICKDLGIKAVPCIVIDIPNENEWHYIVNKNFCRRQMNANEQSYFRGKLYLSEKQAHGGNRKIQKEISATCSEDPGRDQTEKLASCSEEGTGKSVEEFSIGQSSIGDVGTGGNTAERLGKELGVSPKTMRNDGLYSQSLDIIEAKFPSIAKKILEKKSIGNVSSVKRKATERLADFISNNKDVTEESVVEFLENSAKPKNLQLSFDTEEIELAVNKALKEGTKTFMKYMSKKKLEKLMQDFG